MVLFSHWLSIPPIRLINSHTLAPYPQLTPIVKVLIHSTPMSSAACPIKVDFCSLYPLSIDINPAHYLLSPQMHSNLSLPQLPGLCGSKLALNTHCNFELLISEDKSSVCSGEVSANLMILISSFCSITARLLALTEKPLCIETMLMMVQDDELLNRSQSLSSRSDAAVPRVSMTRFYRRYST